MSNSRMLACLDCKEEIWVGQNNTPLYNKETNMLEKLSSFLEEHQNHSLIYYTLFINSPSLQCKEIKWR